MKKKTIKDKVIDLDSVRGKDESLFICLHEDCFSSFVAELPRRKNAVDIVCPNCGRDHYMWWLHNDIQDQVFVNFGKKRRRRD